MPSLRLHKAEGFDSRSAIYDGSRSTFCFLSSKLKLLKSRMLFFSRGPNISSKRMAKPCPGNEIIQISEGEFHFCSKLLSKLYLKSEPGVLLITVLLSKKKRVHMLTLLNTPTYDINGLEKLRPKVPIRPHFLSAEKIYTYFFIRPIIKENRG